MSAAESGKRATTPTDTWVEPGELHARLARTWGTKRGLWGALTTVDHKIIGRRYIVTAFASCSSPAFWR
jgi:hypothetical protein